MILLASIVYLIVYIRAIFTFKIEMYSNYIAHILLRLLIDDKFSVAFFQMQHQHADLTEIKKHAKSINSSYVAYKIYVLRDTM